MTANNMLPNAPDGAIGILYGRHGSHKTNTLLSMLTKCSAQRILYAAGEGAYGVERDRIPLHPELYGRLKILDRVPLLNREDHVKAFIDGCRAIKWEPQIIVIDTLATALAGQDENTAEAAQHLTDNGAIGVIKRAFKCTVILVAHTGKDGARGVRGSSGFEANADFVIRCDADKDSRTIKLTCTKMRDGYDGHSTFWTYAQDGVPCPTQITEAEHDALLAVTYAPRDETTPVGLVVRSFLHTHGHHDWLTGVEPKELALFLTEQEHGRRPVELEEAAAWDTSRAKWLKSLHNLKTKSWAKECHDEQVPVGGGEMALRWFCPPQGQVAQEEM